MLTQKSVAPLKIKQIYFRHIFKTKGQRIKNKKMCLVQFLDVAKLTVGKTKT